MKQNSQSRLYVFFFVLQILTLFGCGKFKQAPLFGSTLEKDNSKQVILRNIVNSTIKPNDKTNTYKNHDSIIVIDPGHQKTPDYKTEPIGPGSDKKKAKVSTGSRGIQTKIPEYELNLIMAKKVKKYLMKEGYRVILTRESNEVNISNKQRTLFANEAEAALLLHIHCNSSTNEKMTGSLAMCPTRKNRYCKDIYEASKDVCNKILEQLCHDSEMKNNGILETDFMAGINYSKVPVCYLELGYLSNEQDEKKLTSKEFEDFMANSIVKGINAYFNNE